MSTSGSKSLCECRHELISNVYERFDERAQPEGVESLQQTFFPTRSLKEIFNLGLVKKILTHHEEGSNDCPECKHHWQGKPQLKPKESDAERVLRTDSSLDLFALLVYLKYPLLIGCFLGKYADGQIPSPRFFTPYDLAELLKHLPEAQMKNFRRRFEDTKWRFSIPKFNHEGTFQIHQSRVIMPYLGQDRIAQGAYGTVYRVKVHPEYCSQRFIESVHNRALSHSRRREIIFARKEFKDQQVIEFLKESTNLELIDTFKHPHIIHIKQTYQLGEPPESFNILFPYAKSNLQDYLRKGGAPLRRHVSKNPMWIQVLGVTEALCKVINFKDPDSERGFRGFHLDLKPQNVLVFHETVPGRPSEDVFKVSDFGQSEFVELGSGRSGTRSSLVGANGTDAYAPPEMYGVGANEAYDVWSLGIIILEILAFAIRGIDGLVHAATGLDNVRHSVDSGFGNHRLYFGQARDARVKQEVTDWIEALLGHPAVQENERELFVQPLVQLIRGMLDPNYKTRMKIDQVLARIREILKSGDSNLSDETAMSMKNGEKVVVDLKSVKIYPEGLLRPSEQSPFYILENKDTILRIFAGRDIRGVQYPRKDMEAVPMFQYSDEPVQDFRFTFKPAPGAAIHSLKDLVIVVEDERYARKLQADLIGHEVSRRFRIRNLEMRLDNPLMKRAKAGLSEFMKKHRHFNTPETARAGHSRSDEEDLKSLWIELWVEKEDAPDQTADVTAAFQLEKSLPRLTREHLPDKSIPLGRVVIYCEDRIIIIPFTREGAIAKPADHEIFDRVIFRPMDEKQRDMFKLSVLKRMDGDRDGNWPRISMCHTTLSKVEKEKESLCKSLVVEFSRTADASEFYSLVRQQKSRWQSLIKGDSTKVAKLATSEFQT